MKIFLLIKKIFKAKQYIIYILDDKGTAEKFMTDNLNTDFIHLATDDLKTSFIEHIGGNQKYGENLEKYDNELFNAYKECDYQIARAEYLEAELDYYKTVNDPMSGDANILYRKYMRVKQLKERYESFA